MGAVMKKEVKPALSAVIKTACMQNCDIIAVPAFVREYFVAQLPRRESNFSSRILWVPLDSFAVVPAFLSCPENTSIFSRCFLCAGPVSGLIDPCSKCGSILAISKITRRTCCPVSMTVSWRGCPVLSSTAAVSVNAVVFYSVCAMAPGRHTFLSMSRSSCRRWRGFRAGWAVHAKRRCVAFTRSWCVPGTSP